jgi:preprotein translocase subunit SecA
MLKRLFNKIIGDPNQKTLAALRAPVQEVARLESRYQALGNDQLREAAFDLRTRLQEGTEGEELLPEAFALVREASRRATGLRHYDVQIMGGILLYRGNVIEMRTGEGKTLVATLPLFLHALAGYGVHLVTVNDYLVRRDGGWMGKIFHLLGLTVGCIGGENFSALYDPDYVNPGAELEDERLVHWRPCTRQEAYLADVTYGTSSEFGFDYLRDNMATDKGQLVQRHLYSAVIDEVDNILIDESRTPLIISGQASRSGKEYARFAEYVRRLKENTADPDTPPNGHYDIDHKSRSVTLTESGIAEIERRIPEIDQQKGESLYDPAFFELTYYLDNAMKAEYLFHRDQEYMVTAEGQVVIIDDFTGRPMPSRRYSDGLHEAIEAKEGVDIKQETVTVATITLQNYFRMYDNLAGMTGTAMTDAEEFERIYNLGVFPLPTNVEDIVQTGTMPLQERSRDEAGTKAIYYVKPGSDEPVFFKRTDYPDQVYSATEAKDKAIVTEITEMYRAGRPVLVGTTSVEHSEKISTMLKRNKVPHRVLNAKMHQSEALVVAQAGRKGAVTISTNMAGRGTDILLGGNPEGLAAGELDEQLFDRRLLGQLAREWLTKGEAAARNMTRKYEKLDDGLIDGLAEVREQFEAASADIAQLQLPVYIARRISQSYGCDIAIARQVVNLVRQGALNQARTYLKAQSADSAIVEEAVRLQELHGLY